MMLTKAMKKVDIKSNTNEGIKSLFNSSLYWSHSSLCPPAEHSVKLEILSTVLSMLRRVTAK